MKRPVASILLILMLLNAMGYYGVLVGWKMREDKALRERFDEEEYTGTEMIVKVPLSVPYGQDSQTFERVDGEFEYEGEFYKLVKQRFQSDTLYIVCTKDTKSKVIHQALTDYVKSFTDKPVNQKNSGKAPELVKKDYVSFTIAVTTSQSGWSLENRVMQSLRLHTYSYLFTSRIEDPPEA